MSDTERFCNKPDRDVPEIVCGYPLPCPWHTVTVDANANPPTLTIPVTSPAAIDPKLRDALKEIAQAITEDEAEPRSEV